MEVLQAYNGYSHSLDQLSTPSNPKELSSKESRELALLRILISWVRQLN